MKIIEFNEIYGFIIIIHRGNRGRRAVLMGLVTCLLQLLHSADDLTAFEFCCCCLFQLPAILGNGAVKTIRSVSGLQVAVMKSLIVRTAQMNDTAQQILHQDQDVRFHSSFIAVFYKYNEMAHWDLLKLFTLATAPNNKTVILSSLFSKK